ncbi:MAG: ribosomal-protein-alanine N-acetyltransferase [Dehalococcoidia bacterium]|nr:ribosomal-protein-alanine N-acetyltransferase [Dehalococcoidia bacterium]
MDVRIRHMTESDIPVVSKLEAEAFPEDAPTPLQKELENRLASYLVACYVSPAGKGAEVITGYCGVWLVLDESHLLSIAVKAEYRGRSIGELLLLSALDDVISRGAESMFLEVRISNTTARSLYEKYGFTRLGVRRGYYADNNEDAVVMAASGINEPSYIEFLAARRMVAAGKLREY